MQGFRFFFRIIYESTDQLLPVTQLSMSSNFKPREMMTHLRSQGHLKRGIRIIRVEYSFDEDKTY